MGTKMARRGQRGMARLGAFTEALRNRLYGRDTYPPRVPLNRKLEKRWIKVTDDAIRFQKFRYEEVNDLSAEFIEKYGTVEPPEKVHIPSDLDLLERWTAFVKSKFDRERVDSFTKMPGYVAQGRGVQTVVEGIKEFEHAKELKRRREEKRAREEES